LATLAQQSTTAITYVFFPMNAVQFGMSDLDAAALIHKRLGARADFRVWEADPDVDDILYLLCRMDCVVAMRYHAAIFALSQNLPVLGIDYPGAGAKVERLFQDLGQHANVCGMDGFTGAWLVSEASRLLTGPRAIELVRSVRSSAFSTG
jgi:polysaccharide pyruvyl transferase WcaK-like protein